MIIYPITVVPQPYQRVWGGRLLAERFRRWGKVKAPVGEIWSLYGQSCAANGPYRGMTLDELMAKFAEPLMGRAVKPGETFPLLVKWLDTSAWLSVQVHPNDETAQSHCGSAQAVGKTEAWYVVNAAPQAQLIFGLKQKHSVDELRKLTGKAILEHLQVVNPQCGDALLVKPGTLHALGPGLTVLEVQQSCDITYRLYDWERLGLNGQPRDLHTEQAWQAIEAADQACSAGGVEGGSPQLPEGWALGRELLACDYFAMDLLDLQRGQMQSWTPANGPEILAVLEGEVSVFAGGVTLEVPVGEVCLLPAQAGKVSLIASRHSQLMRVLMPPRSK